MPSSNSVMIEIPGHPFQCVDSDALPPIGTRFQVHKHLTDGGTYLTLEVIAHEWRLEEPGEPDTNAYFSISVRTRIVG
jgi:hypothetical protein